MNAFIKNTNLVFVSIVFFCSSGFANISGNECDIEKISDSNRADLVAEYRRLRSSSGHFTGGDWNECADAWDGVLHKTMKRLSAFLIVKTSNETELLELFGEPDNEVLDVDHNYEFLLNNVEWTGEPHGKIWVYSWRGNHDQFLVVVFKGAVVAKGWFYVLE